MRSSDNCRVSGLPFNYRFYFNYYSVIVCFAVEISTVQLSLKVSWITIDHLPTTIDHHTPTMAFRMLAARGSRSAATTYLQSSRSQHIGSISLFSSSAAADFSAASKQQSPLSNQYGRFISPTTILPPSQTPSNRRVSENLVWRTALLQDMQKKQKEDINVLERMLDTLRIARLPTTISTPTPTSGVSNPQQQRTFQVMNRNARKAKRANHGKRPCSRIRRRYKVKKWANTSRKG